MGGGSGTPPVSGVLDSSMQSTPSAHGGLLSRADVLQTLMGFCSFPEVLTFAPAGLKPPSLGEDWEFPQPVPVGGTIPSLPTLLGGSRSGTPAWWAGLCLRADPPTSPLPSSLLCVHSRLPGDPLSGTPPPEPPAPRLDPGQQQEHRTHLSLCDAGRPAEHGPHISLRALPPGGRLLGQAEGPGRRPPGSSVSSGGKAHWPAVGAGLQGWCPEAKARGQGQEEAVSWPVASDSWVSKGDTVDWLQTEGLEGGCRTPAEGGPGHRPGGQPVPSAHARGPARGHKVTGTMP